MIDSLSKEKRRQVILDFIRTNQGCYKEAIVKDENVKMYASKKTVYRIIDELENEGKIRKEEVKPNARGTKLYLDEGNPLVLIPLEVKETKNAFLDVLKKARVIRDIYRYQSKVSIERTSDEKTSNENTEPNSMRMIFAMEFLSIPQVLLDIFQNVYVQKSKLVWTEEVKNPSNYAKVIAEYMTEINFLQVEISELIKPLTDGEKKRIHELIAEQNIQKRRIAYCIHICRLLTGAEMTITDSRSNENTSSISLKSSKDIAFESLSLAIKNFLDILWSHNENFPHLLGIDDTK